MSQGGGKDVPGMSMKMFVTQEEIEETRRKRQEEWEKKRTPDQPLECPEEEVDNRSLFDRLQEQKQRKDDEYEAQHSLKNSVHTLDEDEVGFLDYVSKKQMQIDKQRQSEEDTILKEIKEASVAKLPTSKTQEEKKPSVKAQIGASQNKKSQQALLAGAVKRKSTEADTDVKKRKLPENAEAANSTENTTNHRTSALQTGQIIGILPGVGAYNNDSSDSESTSDDESDTDFKLRRPKTYVMHVDHE